LQARGGSFNGHPPLGVNATPVMHWTFCTAWQGCFNGHPPLGVNATKRSVRSMLGYINIVSMGTYPWG